MIYRGRVWQLSLLPGEDEEGASLRSSMLEKHRQAPVAFGMPGDSSSKECCPCHPPVPSGCFLSIWRIPGGSQAGLGGDIPLLGAPDSLTAPALCQEPWLTMESRTALG